MRSGLLLNALLARPLTLEQVVAAVEELALQGHRVPRSASRWHG